MGHITKSIAFFVDTITLMPHSARSTTGYPASQYLDREVSIREFSQGLPCSLSQNEDTGEYTVTLANGDFIEGPEI